MQSPREARETYLEEVSARMRGRLSSLELFETIREMRDHIDATAAAYEEVGLDSVSAMAAALEKFGNPQRIGAEVASAVKPRSSAGLAFAVLHSVTVSAGLGALLLTVFDLTMILLNYDRAPTSILEVLAAAALTGATVGLLVGLVAWMAPFRPKVYAVTLCVMLNALFFYTVYPFYFLHQEWQTALEIGVGMTTALFYLAHTSVKMARKAAARLSDDLPGPMKRA